MNPDKSPSAILNETLSKLGILPVYEVFSVNDITGQKNFEMKITCDTLTAKGMGKTKKEAKHNAAREMLRQMGTDIVCNQSVLNTTALSSENLTVNTKDYVSELKNLSVRNKMGDPIYKDTSFEGPPHCVTFTVQCLVLDYQIEGKGKSKRLARQDAAKKMLEKLSGNNSNDKSQELEGLLNNKIDSAVVQKQDDKIIQKYSEPKIRIDDKKVLKLKLSHYDAVSKLKDLTMLINEFSYHGNDHVLQEKQAAKIKMQFQNLLDSTHIDFYHMLVQTSEPVTFQLSIQLNTVPDIFETSLGKTKEEAEVRAIGKVILSLGKIIV